MHLTSAVELSRSLVGIARRGNNGLGEVSAGGSDFLEGWFLTRGTVDRQRQYRCPQPRVVQLSGVPSPVHNSTLQRKLAAPLRHLAKRHYTCQGETVEEDGEEPQHHLDSPMGSCRFPRLSGRMLTQSNPRLSCKQEECQPDPTSASLFTRTTWKSSRSWKAASNYL